MAGNELGRARISMMARSISSNTRPDTLVRDHRLQSHDFPLQRTAGPYIGVKRFQTIHGRGRQCHSRARASLRNRHTGPTIMGFEDEVERSFRRPCRRQVQADMRTHLIHRPARDIIPPLGGLEFPPIAFDPERSSRCSNFSGPSELSAISPDAMHNHGQPSR